MSKSARSQFIRSCKRRGNALILVAGVLVLLVIIATVFLSRTRTLRELGTAQRQGAFHRDRMESAAGEIAQELADSLFVRPIDFTEAEYGLGVPPEEARRKAPDVSATRYGVDPDFAWNRAPWAVVPWTNPPDWLTWPLRPGKLRQMVNDREIQVPPDLTTTTWRWIEDRQGGQVDLFNWPNAPESWPPATEPYWNAVLQPRENPLGGPGVSDTRWLRDLEPQRTAPRWLGKPLDVNGWNAILNPFLDRAAGAYSHWRHLSWIGRPGNGWRMCPDIADVTGIRSNIDADGHRFTVDSGSDPVTWADGRAYYGGVYQRNDVPLEQWPATLPMEYDPLSNRLVRLADSNPDFNEAYKFGDTATAPYRFDDPLVSVTEGAQDLSGPPDEVVMDFWDRWLTWLRPEGYRQAITAARGGSGHMLPPNFYDLDDLDGDGVRGEYYDPSTIPSDPEYVSVAGDPRRWGETPSDEFRPGTARWNVSRILTDTDGDGFTDSFWWLSPHVGVDGTRQVIGVSVTDNSGRLNGNVATRFVKADGAGAFESTRGWTPADLALVSQNFAPVGSDAYAPDAAPVWNTGFFDIEAHQPALLETSWNESQNAHPDLTTPFVTYPEGGGGSGQGWSEAYQWWNSNNWRATSNRSFLEAVNIDAGSVPNPFFPDVYPFDISDRDNRLFYFRESGQEPQHPENIFTPFNLADELELRAYEGNNHGWIYSRLERALGPSTDGSDHILRGNLTRMETSEAAEQLDNRQLAHDLRHRLTFFNGARNETLPPHLWWEHRAPAPRADDIVVGGGLPGTGLVAASDIRVEDMHERFNEQMREKIDLREWERAARSLPSFNTEYDPRTFSNRIGQGLMLGLTSGHVSDRDPGGNLIDPVTGLDFIAQPATGQTIPLRGGRDSYFGAGDEAWEKTRRLAAAMTANMLASRDPDQTQPLLSIEGVVSGAPTPNQWHAELGAVPLPFFEGAYYPDDLAAYVDPEDYDDIVFPGGETVRVGGSTDPDHLLGDWSYGGEGAGNGVSDHVDLSDISRSAFTRPSPGIAKLQPWSIVAVGIDDDGDGDADWVEKRPWCLSGDPRVVRRVRDIFNVAAPTQPTVIEINGTDNNFDGFPDVPLGSDFRRIPAWDEAYAPETHMLGMEPQPFISEVFFAEVAKPWMFPDGLICQNTECDNAGSWYWLGNHAEREKLELFGAGDPAGNATIDGDDLPDIPRAIFAVQLVNPYSKAIPLMRRNENTGQLEPIYKLRLLTPNRFQSSTASTTWEIPLDPTTLGAMRTFEYAQTDSWHENWDDPDDTDGIDELVPTHSLHPSNDPIPMLPPATNDAPYSLMIVLNGMELADWRGSRHQDVNGNDRPSEVVQWLDFLDAEPSRHPSGHLVLDPEASANNQSDTYRTLQPGELIWRIDPSRLFDPSLPESSTNIDPEQITKSAYWYRQDMSPPAEPDTFKGPTIDPNLGSMVELVRTHQSEIESYTADVVIDRTAGLDGTDELLHVVGAQLPLHTISASHNLEHAFQSTVGIGHVDFEVSTSELFEDESGKPKLDNYNITYPRALQTQHLDPETGEITEANNPSALNGAGSNSLVELAATRPQWRALGIDPWDARWMQWGRYSRAWAVDDVDEQRTMDTQPDTAIDGPDFDDVNEANRRLWRPDRAAPRFVAGDSRVTRSWSRDWANQLGLQPDPPFQYATKPNSPDWDPEALDGQSFDLRDGGLVQWPPVVAAKLLNGTDPDHKYRVSYNSTWGRGLINAPQHVVGAGNPVLVGGNLPNFGPDLYQQPDWTGPDWAQPQLGWDRRWAEQKMGMASDLNPPGNPAKLDANLTIVVATGLANWDSWTVNDPDTNTRRRINLVVIGDPANDWDKNNDGLLDDMDSRLPANTTMLTVELADSGDTIEVVPPDKFFPSAVALFAEDQWEFGWRGRNAPNAFNGTEHWDSYQSAMRFKHGNIINWTWDPDGIGRLEQSSGDEFPFLGSGNVSAPYLEENPYPYPWATRNVRLPWTYSIDVEQGAGDFDTDEYYLYEARKPTFFAFGHQRNVDGTIYESDRGYNPNTQAVQSYPDKGFYGPAEIDGEILMPFGYQVQLKDANFEQVGEVLEVPTIAHELHVPMNQPVGGGPAFSWPADYYNQWPATPNLSLVWQIQTIKTYSEALAEEIAAGAGKSAGHLHLGGTIDGPNAIVGDPRTTYEVSPDHLLVIHEPYDLVSSVSEIPDWYLAANDVSHIGPDLPAVQRLLDMFVVDGPGIYDLVESNPDDLYSFNSPWPDGYIDDPEDWALYADPPTAGQLAARSANFDNAGGFEGRPTRGLVNINTASVEVLRSMPHMYRMVHGDPNGAATPLLDQVVSSNSGNPERPLSPHPRTAVPEAISQYRDGLGQIQQRFSRSDNDPPDEPDPPLDFDPLRDDLSDDHWSPFNELVPGVPYGAPYSDRGYGGPRDAWGLDNTPRTGDDAIPPIDPVFDDLAEDYNMSGLADTNADETVRYSRGTRGFAGIGELLQLTRPAYYDSGFANLSIDGQVDDIEDRDLREPLGTSVAADAWRIDWSGRNPFGWQDSQVNGPYGDASGGTTLYDNRSGFDSNGDRLRDALDNPGAFLSTDTDRYHDTQVPGLSDFEPVASWPANEQWEDPLGGYGGFQHAGTDDPRYRELHLTGDRVAGDAEEQSLLFSGISNLVTTRSDVFTVHLRVRTFRRNPETGVWDATDRSQIVDDSRYVMLVDRSEVDHPGDKPRIMLMQRIAD